MSTNRRTNLVLLAMLLIAGFALAAKAAPPPVTYQGQLKFNGVPYDGLADFSFALYDRPTDGTKLCTYEQYSVDVDNGLFTVEMLLDGTGCFDGEERWLEIWVRTPEDSALLDPRQRVTYAPYALYALDAPGGAGLWDAAGSDIYYKGGKVGVGLADPSYPLHVYDETGGPVVVGDNRGTGTQGQLGGDSAGVYGAGTASAAVGVYGEVTDPAYYGVHGVTENGSGVKGEATGPYGTGVEGYAVNPTWAAIYGLNEATTGNAIGVLGNTVSPDGFGGYFYGQGYFSSNLGVGVEDPTEMLDVAGTIQATGFKLTTAPAAGWVLTSNASGVGTWQPSGGGGSSYWSIDPNTDSIYYGDGYVGVGHGASQSVDYPLHVLGMAAMTGFKLGTSATPGDVLTAGSDGVGTWQALPGGGSSLWTQSGSDIYYDNGKVGIGTTAPAYRLHVVDQTDTSIGGENVGQGTAGYLGYNHAGVYGTADSYRTAVHGRASDSSGKGVFGESWGSHGKGVIGYATGDGDTIGVEGYVQSSTGKAVYAYNEANDGEAMAIKGEIISPDGTAVQGKALVGAGVGVHGQTISGSGVVGEATGAAGGTGVEGRTQSWDGFAVLGINESTIGDAVGVKGETSSDTGRAVYGHALSTGTSTSYGVYGQVDSTRGRGVYGEATNTEGLAYGVVGKSSAEGGTGVRGEAWGSGWAVGVSGHAQTTTGFAIYGFNENEVGAPVSIKGEVISPDGRAVFGEAMLGAGYGVYGKTVSGHGVYGEATGTIGGTGVEGHTQSTTGLAVYGINEAAVGDAVAIKGETPSPTGRAVQGHATSTAVGTAYGVHGQADSRSGVGVYGKANGQMGRGVYGTAPDGTGVYGETTNGIGVEAYSQNPTGKAVYAFNEAETGDAIAVYGDSPNSPNGYGGYFVGRGYFSGNVGIGVKPDTTPLKVDRPAGTGAGPAIAGQASGYSTTGVYGFASDPAESCTGVRGESSSPAGYGVKGTATANSGTSAGVRGQSNSPTGRGIEGVNYIGGWAGYFQGRTYMSSRLGIGTDNPLELLDVDGTARMAGFKLTTAPSDGYVLTSDANGVGTWQESTGGGSFDLPYIGTITDGGTAFKITNNGTGPGAHGIFAEIPNGSSSDAVAGYFTSQGGSARALRALADAATAITAQNNGVSPTLDVKNSGSGNVIEARSGSDVVFRVAGTGITHVNVLAVEGGADLAERFDVGESAKPGMVVEIDPDHVGKLRVAQDPYSRRVAGVISGANGVDAGMILGNLPGDQDTQPVALSGRVWVYCDATERPITAGDLLTTAPRPGHAMAVADYTRAQGAVLGKAMSSLDEGTGLVLVLVSLQ